MKSIIKSQKIKFGTWLNFSNKSKTEWLNFFMKLSEVNLDLSVLFCLKEGRGEV